MARNKTDEKPKAKGNPYTNLAFAVAFFVVASQLQGTSRNLALAAGGILLFAFILCVIPLRPTNRITKQLSDFRDNFDNSRNALSFSLLTGGLELYHNNWPWPGIIIMLFGFVSLGFGIAEGIENLVREMGKVEPENKHHDSWLVGFLRKGLDKVHSIGILETIKRIAHKKPTRDSYSGRKLVETYVLRWVFMDIAILIFLALTPSGFMRIPSGGAARWIACIPIGILIFLFSWRLLELLVEALRNLFNNLNGTMPTRLLALSLMNLLEIMAIFSYYFYLTSGIFDNKEPLGIGNSIYQSISIVTFSGISEKSTNIAQQWLFSLESTIAFIFVVLIIAATVNSLRTDRR